MIKDICFNNYKCLKDSEAFNLSRVNVFTGYNGRGKSSVIQAILILSQSIKKDDLTSLSSLHVNGEWVFLGDFIQILKDDHSDEVGINITISNDKEPTETAHNVDLKYCLSEDFMVGKLSHCCIDGDCSFFSKVGTLENNDPNGQDGELSRQLPPYINNLLQPQNIHFVSANRVGPVKFVEKRERPEYYHVGANGAHTINTISSFSEKVPASMNVDPNDKESHTLPEVTSDWVSRIFNGGSVKIFGDEFEKSLSQSKKTDTPASSVLTLSFSIDNYDKRVFQSYNVGFGYSYVLSIIVTALIAKEGNIVIIENPEAHLHPEAQLQLTYLLAKLAARGVQVFVETHSEHIINGFRLSALKDDYHIDHNDIKFFFFDKDFSVTTLNIEKNGRINNWPDRFFDQYQFELAEIIKLGATKE